MKSTLLRRKLFVFALVATLLAGSLTAAASAAAAPQRKAAATVQRRAPQPQQKPASAPTPASPLAEAAPFVNKVLANGLEVIVLEDHSVPLVTCELAVRNGSFTEPPELNGLSHLYEHMFFKVSRERGMKTDYLQTIDQLGIVYNGETHEEVVDYYFTTTTPNFPVAMRFMRDQARFQTFDEQQFAQEREVVVGELDRHESNPYGEIGEQMNNRLFYKYPSRKDPGGNRQTVRAATTDMMRLIQSRYYVPNNSAIVITGDVTPPEAFKMVEDLFGDWARRERDPFAEFPLVEHPPLPKSEANIITKPVTNVVVELGWQGPSIGKDDAATYAADVFSFILRQPNSRFQRALTDTGLATAVGFGYYTQRNTGPITLILQTTPDKARAAVAAVYNEIAHFNDPNYFTDEELESAKALLEADDLYSREKLSEYSHTISFWWASTGLDYFRGYLKRLRATSRADISRYVTTYVQGKPHVGLAMMSDESLKTSGLTEGDLLGNSAPLSKAAGR
ncbi:MAG: zinc protease [Acidobacteriota bacterium]|jgi:zinc protease|nr:zinc protease [Acidobacteriota bacterium]MDT7780760.1 zinc protease [Acidobacteriota bacterium]